MPKNASSPVVAVVVAEAAEVTEVVAVAVAVAVAGSESAGPAGQEADTSVLAAAASDLAAPRFALAPVRSSDSASHKAHQESHREPP